MADKKPETLDTVGKVLPGPMGRDAVHIAMVAVEAAEDLKPGDRVGPAFGPGSKVWTRAKRLVGIVDPYLREDVKAGQWFWLFLFPQTITSLRHVWTHPAFPNELYDPAEPPSES